MCMKNLNHITIQIIELEIQLKIPNLWNLMDLQFQVNNIK